MEKLNFRHAGEAINEAHIRALEKELKIEFPKVYVDFILENNGGIPDRIFFHTAEYGYVVGQFFPIDNSAEGFQSYYNQFKSILPVNLIPIADDAFGNLICLHKVSGKVYFWSHEDGDDSILSDSLTSFLNNLKKDV